MTNSTSPYPTSVPTVDSQSNEDSHSYEIIIFGVMGGMLIVCILASINEFYGPFYGVERSHPVSPEGVEPSNPRSFMNTLHTIWDVVDAYHAATGNQAISTGEIYLAGVSDSADEVTAL